jgi:hypothetical protein
MRGRPLTDVEYQSVSMSPIEDLVGAPRPKGKGSVSPARRRQYLDEAKERAAGKGWQGAKPGALLGLYCHLHHIVYGVWPSELDAGGAWHQAMLQVGAFVKREFGGDGAACAEFVAWAWRREEQRDKYRQARGEERRRMMWRWLFGRSMLTDYAAAGMRRKVG